jgi:DNA-binding NarL/FixJ family response regulator
MAPSGRPMPAAWSSGPPSRPAWPGSFAGRPAPAEVALPGLNDRERSVLELLAAGRSNDAIARELYVSNKTVRNTVSSIYAKLHAAGRAEAIIKARDAGFGRS